MKNVSFTYPEGVVFECTRCGLCCGDTDKKTRRILLLEPEAEAISAKTSLPKPGFSKKVMGKEPYCREMKKDREGKCCFLKDNHCTIYEQRPLICRFYPFELKFSSSQNQHVFAVTFECPAIGKGKLQGKTDFEKLFALAKERLV